MAFLIVGILLLTLKLAEFGPVAGWPWWGVLLPFGLTVAWWGVSDKLGLTQRRAINQMERKKAVRRLRNLEALGLGPLRDRRPRAARDFSSSDMHRRAAKDPTHAE